MHIKGTYQAAVVVRVKCFLFVKKSAVVAARTTVVMMLASIPYTAPSSKFLPFDTLIIPMSSLLRIRPPELL